MNSWLLWILLNSLTGNPLIAVVLLIAFLYGGESWWRGRLWLPWAFFQQWMRIRELRATVQQNEYDLKAREDLGWLLVERRAYAEARPHLELVVAKSPTRAQAAWNLGRACLGLGDFDAGLAAIQSALQIRPDTGHGQPHFDLADFEYRRGRHKEAIAHYERGLAIHASSSEAYYKVGCCRAALGDKAGARAAWKEAVQIADVAPSFKRGRDRPWRWRAWWKLTTGG